jgi:heme exporter protein D
MRSGIVVAGAQVLTCNVILVVLAGGATSGYVWPALTASAVTVAVLLAILECRAHSAPKRS